MNPSSSVTESRIHKKSMNFIHSTLSKFLVVVVVVVVGGGGGGLHSTFTFYLMKLCIGYRFVQPQGGCRILMKHGIPKFIVSTVAIVCEPFGEQRVTKKSNKLKNCDWFLK